MNTIMYVSDQVKAGSTVNLGICSCYHKPLGDLNVPLTILAATAHGDYSGGAVERSNYEVLSEDEELKDVLVYVAGPYGHRSLGFLGTETPGPLVDVLAGLDSYPLIDDDHHSELESKLETEAWEDWGRRDFRKALLNLLDSIDPGHAHDLDEAPDESIDTVWRDGCRDYNVNGGTGYCIETGCGVHFYTGQWITKAGRKPADLVSFAQEHRTEGSHEAQA